MWSTLGAAASWPFYGQLHLERSQPGRIMPPRAEQPSAHLDRWNGHRPGPLDRQSTRSPPSPAPPREQQSRGRSRGDARRHLHAQHRTYARKTTTRHRQALASRPYPRQPSPRRRLAAQRVPFSGNVTGVCAFHIVSILDQHGRQRLQRAPCSVREDHHMSRFEEKLRERRGQSRPPGRPTRHQGQMLRYQGQH